MTILEMEDAVDDFERDTDSRFQRSEPSEWKYRRRPKYCRKVKIQRKNVPARSRARATR